MMTTDATTTVNRPSRGIARWRVEAYARAREWATRVGVPYSPWLAVKAL